MRQLLHNKGRLLLGISNSHGVLGSNFETLKGLHGHGGLHIIFKFHKCNTWLRLNHSDFPKSWVLLEEHLQHHASGFMGQVLNKQYIIWRSCFLCTLVSMAERSLHIRDRQDIISKN